ncbi:MAG TPA: glycosyltransferase [Chthoniobacterales bacterium]|nr:glycosyltransferase [Chthoniobacterales bacterium]
MAKTLKWLRRSGRTAVEIAVDHVLSLQPKRWRQKEFIAKVLANSSPTLNKRFIVALSTIPDRIKGLRPTIDSLLNQTRRPDEIVLAVPKFSLRQQRPYDIPDWLHQVPDLRILRCDKDWGPATKFIAVVQDELAAARPDTLIMVVDDDRLCPPDSIQLYLHYHEQLPDAVLTFRGGPIPQSMNWRDCKIEFGVDLQTPKQTAVITGCGSYLIQPRFFDESLWDYSSAPAGAFYVDDMWISGCLERRGVERYIIPASDVMRSVLRQIGTMTLHDVPNGRHQHNNETIAFFAENWKVSRSR